MTCSRFISARSVSVILLGCLTASCATPGTSGYQYREPTGPGTVKNEVIMKRPFSDAWDILVGELAKSFFVINNVEKVSRIINVFFSTDTPEKYIDCGTTERTYSYAEKAETYNYSVASASSYKVAGKWGPFENLPVIGYVDRKTSLEGRINVYVAPRDNDTIVTVNTRYILTARSSGQQEFLNGAGVVVQKVAVPERQATISFNTGQVGSADWGNGAAERAPIKCRSTGQLESEILTMANR